MIMKVYRTAVSYLTILGMLLSCPDVNEVWAGFEDQHDVNAIIKALKSPIPSEAVAKAQQFDDALMNKGEVEGTKVYLVTDDRSKRVYSLVRKLLVAMKEDDHDWVVRVLDTEPPAVNAFVTGGKYIYVFTGLLDGATSDDELAFVLSHEIGHSLLKQNLREQEDITTTLANLADLIAAVAAKNNRKDIRAVTQGVRAGYSRTDEEEADAIAVAISWRAGFDPLRGVDFFGRSAREENRAEEQVKQALTESQGKAQALVNECNGRVQAINQVRASGRNVANQYLYQTQLICNQAQQAASAHNSMAAEYNLKNSERVMAAIYNTHPNHQNRIAAVAALTDYVAGRRSLESLQQYQQSYRVMAALRQTNSVLMKRIDKVDAATKSPKTQVGQEKPSGKSMSDQLKQLKQAFDEGLLTEEEYQNKRRRILDNF